MSDLISGDPYDPEDDGKTEERLRQINAERSAQVHQILMRRQEAYRRVFGHEDAKLVLTDLMSFCRGNETTFHENDRVHCLLTGRNEVYQRVKDHTELSLDELIVKYNRGQTKE